MNYELHHRTAQNLCSTSCPVKHIDVPLDQIKQPQRGWPDIRGLNSLNYSRSKWLTGDAIEVSIAGYCRGLPEALQSTITLGMPGLHPKFWHTGPDSEDAMFRAIHSPAKRALNKMKATEYSIFPVCVDGMHWVLIVVHKSQRPSAADKKQLEWSHVSQIAVIEPGHSAKVTAAVNDKLATWLRKAGKFTFASDYRRTVWVPFQPDGTSCGPRAYWNAKQILDRLLYLHEDGIHYDECVWDDFSGWFNEDFVRGEMMGRCAWEAVRAMDYNARVAVECVNEVREYNSDVWQSAERLMRPADIKGQKPETRSRPFRPPRTPGGGGSLQSLAPNVSSPNPFYTDNSMPPSTPQRAWRPPPPILNQHIIAPGAKHTGRDVTSIAGEDRENEDILRNNLKSPAWPATSSPRNPFLPPNALSFAWNKTPGGRSSNPTEPSSNATSFARDNPPGSRTSIPIEPSSNATSFAWDKPPGSRPSNPIDLTPEGIKTLFKGLPTPAYTPPKPTTGPAPSAPPNRGGQSGGGGNISPREPRTPNSPYERRVLKTAPLAPQSPGRAALEQMLAGLTAGPARPARAAALVSVGQGGGRGQYLPGLTASPTQMTPRNSHKAANQRKREREPSMVEIIKATSQRKREREPSVEEVPGPSPRILRSGKKRKWL
ncbi:hypothetical protein F4802DRAFT_124850 [Xylaria palmicola]|nr:hypothetical protein F4802DRAFT_124850 [Xylaria palmicola]